jgi:hypothetical protein
VKFTTGLWAVGFPLFCTGRGVNPAPDRDTGTGRLAAGSIETSELYESNLLALRFSVVTLGAFCESAVSLPTERGWCPPDRTVFCLPDPRAFAEASASLLFLSATMYLFSYRKRRHLDGVEEAGSRWRVEYEGCVWKNTGSECCPVRSVQVVEEKR